MEKEHVVYPENPNAKKLYDAWGLHFKNEHPVPKNANNCRLRIEVVYEDENNEEKSSNISLLLWIDQHPPKLEFKILDRKIDSDEVEIEYILTDDSIVNNVNLFRLTPNGRGGDYFDRIASKNISKEDMTVTSGNNTYVGKFTAKLYDGLNKFDIEANEAGTQRYVWNIFFVYKAKSNSIMNK